MRTSSTSCSSPTGRRPNTDGLGLEEHGVALDSNGFVKTDVTMRTSAANISAAGDVAGAPLLAHKAAHEALVAVDRLAGVETSVRHDLVPSVTYTSPEVASVGMTLDAAAPQGCVEPGALGPVRGDRSSGRDRSGRRIRAARHERCTPSGRRRADRRTARRRADRRGRARRRARSHVGRPRSDGPCSSHALRGPARGRARRPRRPSPHQPTRRETRCDVTKPLPLDLSPEQLMHAYRAMALARRIEAKGWDLVRQNKVLFAINSAGHEAVSVGRADGDGPSRLPRAALPGDGGPRLRRHHADDASVHAVRQRRGDRSWPSALRLLGFTGAPRDLCFWPTAQSPHARRRHGVRREVPRCRRGLVVDVR